MEVTLGKVIRRWGKSIEGKPNVYQEVHFSDVSGLNLYVMFREEWVDRHLAVKGRTRQELARVLWFRNLTAVAEVSMRIVDPPPGMLYYVAVV